MDGKISVIIPSYNPPVEYLKNLYDSLILQSHGNFEAILVDDASNPPYPYDHLLRDERFRVIYKERNSGPAACRMVVTWLPLAFKASTTGAMPAIP